MYATLYGPGSDTDPKNAHVWERSSRNFAAVERNDKEVVVGAENPVANFVY